LKRAKGGNGQHAAQAYNPSPRDCRQSDTEQDVKLKNTTQAVRHVSPDEVDKFLDLHMFRIYPGENSGREPGHQVKGFM